MTLLLHRSTIFRPLLQPDRYRYRSLPPCRVLSTASSSELRSSFPSIPVDSSNPSLSLCSPLRPLTLSSSQPRPPAVHRSLHSHSARLVALSSPAWLAATSSRSNFGSLVATTDRSSLRPTRLGLRPLPLRRARLVSASGLDSLGFTAHCSPILGNLFLSSCF